MVHDCMLILSEVPFRHEQCIRWQQGHDGGSCLPTNAGLLSFHFFKNLVLIWNSTQLCSYWECCWISHGLKNRKMFKREKKKVEKKSSRGGKKYSDLRSCVFSSQVLFSFGDFLQTQPSALCVHFWENEIKMESLIQPPNTKLYCWVLLLCLPEERREPLCIKW